MSGTSAHEQQITGEHGNEPTTSHRNKQYTQHTEVHRTNRYIEHSEIDTIEETDSV